MSDTYLGEADFETRNAILKAMANRAGMRLPETIIPEGTSLLPVGEENKRRLAAEVSALPDVAAGMQVIRDVLTKEAHQNVKAPISLVRMNPVNGGLYAEGKDKTKALAYTTEGFSQVASFIKPASITRGFNENMLALPSDLRAEVFNHWATNRPKAQDVVIRTFKKGERQVVRAVTSELHSQETGDDLALLPALLNIPKGAKLRYTRDNGGSHSEMELLWPAMERQLVVGDVAMMAVRIVNSETKAGSLKVQPVCLRIQCWNFTTAWSDGLDEELTFRHVGDLTRKLPRAIDRAIRAIEPFVKAFGDAYRVPFAAALPTRSEILTRARKVLELSENTADLAAKLWDADGAASAGNTLGGFVNALTRASQELEIEAAGHVEKMAGRVVVQGWDALLG